MKEFEKINLLEKGKEVYNKKHLFGFSCWVDNYSGSFEEKSYLRKVRDFFVRENNGEKIIWKWDNDITEKILMKTRTGFKYTPLR